MNVLLTLSGGAKACDFGGGVQLLSSIVTPASAAGSGSSAVTLACCAPRDVSCCRQQQPRHAHARDVVLCIFMWQCCSLQVEVPLRRVSPSLIEVQVKAGARMAMPSAPIHGFPPDYAPLMRLPRHRVALTFVPQTCLHQHPARRTSASEAFRRLVTMDPTARPSLPLPLYPLHHCPACPPAPACSRCRPSRSTPSLPCSPPCSKPPPPSSCRHACRLCSRHIH